MQKLVLIAAAGAVGALFRYGLAGLVQRFAGAGFPWGTAAVNLAGCFLAGMLLSLFEHRWPVDGQTRMVVLVGFMGAFTTFSTYVAETGELLRAAQWWSATGNILLQNGLGIVALFAGLSTGRAL